MISSDYLKSIIDYNPVSGKLTWISSRQHINAGSPAGTINKKGYLQVKIDQNLYAGHRLAWLFMKGCWPDNEVDHINGIKSENIWENLREVNHSQNMTNSRVRKDNASGVTGVYLNKGIDRWVARININGKKVDVRCDGTFEGAVKARKEAEIEHYGEFRYQG